MYRTSTLHLKEIEAFKHSWPCHGLPDNLYSIAFTFGSNGDLVDIEAKSRNGRKLRIADFDGPALTALCEDAELKLG